MAGVTTMRKVAAVATSALLVGALLALTQVPVGEEPSEDAVLRLSWHARGERLEECRRATAEELAKQAAHMRQEVICSGMRVAPYELEVTVDGVEVVDGRVAGTGEPGEGSIYVLRDLKATPGRHTVRVKFEREGGGDEAGDEAGDDADEGEDDDEDEVRRETRRHAVPPHLSLDTTLTLGPREIAVITYAAEAERLVVLTRGAPGTPR